MLFNQSGKDISGYYSDPGMITFIVAVFILIEVFGNLMLFAVLHFEKYGMDPLKRTAINQLIYQYIWVLIANNIVAFPIIAIRLLFGPVGKWVTALV